MSSISRVLAGAKVRARVRTRGRSVIVEGPRPVDAAHLLKLMPGVSWVAVGTTVGSFREIGGASGALARKYLRRGDRFTVLAEASGGLAVGDVAGSAVSAVLEAVRGARMDERRPRVRFRAVFDGTEGAVGVELSEGPGGVPTAATRATCLVSGGVHSSVLAWMALLSGFRVRLVHAVVGERSLHASAHLYAELSNRVDPSGLSLEVLEGGEPAASIVACVLASKQPVFGGFHQGCSRIPPALRSGVMAPISLLPEESFEREFLGLGLRGLEGSLDWTVRKSRPAKSRFFGGVRADVNDVLEGLG